MELTLNIMIASVLLVQFLLFVTVMWVLKAKLNHLNGVIRDFITPIGSDQPSPLASTVDVGCDMVARAVMARAKTTFMGQMSGEVRQEQAINGAIAEDAARLAHPLAGTILDNFPTVRKALRKNPQLLDFALSKLMNGVQQPLPNVNPRASSLPDTTQFNDNGRING